jgi:hypothetical protein
MFCTHCGTKNDDQARFCSKCGASLNRDVITPGQPASESSPPPPARPAATGGSTSNSVPQQPAPKPRRKGGLGVLALVLVVLLVLAGGGIFLFRDRIPLLGSMFSQEKIFYAIADPDVSQFTQLVSLDPKGKSLSTIEYSNPSGFWLLTYPNESDLLGLMDVGQDGMPTSSVAKLFDLTNANIQSISSQNSLYSYLGDVSKGNDYLAVQNIANDHLSVTIVDRKGNTVVEYPKYFEAQFLPGQNKIVSLKFASDDNSQIEMVITDISTGEETVVRDSVDPQGQIAPFSLSTNGKYIYIANHTEIAKYTLSTGASEPIYQIQQFALMHPFGNKGQLLVYDFDPDTTDTLIGSLYYVDAEKGTNLLLSKYACSNFLVSSAYNAYFAGGQSLIQQGSFYFDTVFGFKTAPDLKHALYTAEDSNYQYGLYSSDLQNGGHTLIDQGAFQYTASYSPDSKLIAYISIPNYGASGTLYVTDLSGKNGRAIASNVNDFYFSKDGKTITYVTVEGAENGRPISKIMQTDITGNNQKTLEDQIFGLVSFISE